MNPALTGCGPRPEWGRLRSMVFKVLAPLVLFFVLCGPAAAQGSFGMPSLGKPAKPAAGKVETETGKLRQILQETRASISAVEDGKVPAGISAEEREMYFRALEETTLAANRALKKAAELEEAVKARNDASRLAGEWKGFGNDSPKSMLVVDGLIDQRDAVREGLVSFRSAWQNFNNLLPPALEEATAAETRANEAIEAVAGAKDGGLEIAKWRAEAAKASARLAALRARMLQESAEIYQRRMEEKEAELALLEQQIAAARKTASLTEEDIAQVAKAVAPRVEDLEKNAKAYAKRLQAALAERTKQQAAVDAVAAAPPEQQELANLKLSAATEKVDLLEAMKEAAESLLPLQKEWVDAYHARLACMTFSAGPKKTEAIAKLRGLMGKVKAWERVVSDELSAVQAELARREAEIAAIQTGDPRLEIATGRRAILGERIGSMKRSVGMLISMRKLLERWTEEFSENVSQDFAARLSGAGSSLWNGVKKIWTFEITRFDTSIVRGGLVIPQPVPVTVGLVVKAILFFAIGYWLAVMIANRIQNTVVRRGRLAEAHARTLRNWAMIAVCMGLAVTTLQFLKIPLTVFAFFGGALAIGLGFGTQNLIKNFISGIIVLVERKVRVGDILDVGGTIGTVVEVNARSSVIRSADDLETMIPNSVFLENKVTNWTLSNTQLRRSLRVSVDYENDPPMIIAMMKEEVARHGKILKTPEPFVILEDLSDGTLVFVLYFWVDARTTNGQIATSDLRLMIRKRFRESGVSMPQSSKYMKVEGDMERNGKA